MLEPATSAKRARSRGDVVREAILAIALMVLGVATAGASNLDLRSKLFVLAAFMGCLLFRASEGLSIPALIRKQLKKK